MGIDWGKLMESLPGVGDNPTTAEFWEDTWDEGGLDPYDAQDLGNIGNLEKTNSIRTHFTPGLAAEQSTYPLGSGKNIMPEDSFWPTIWKTGKQAYKRTFPLAKPGSPVQPLSKNEMLY